jgi:hypothetical protein
MIIYNRRKRNAFFLEQTALLQQSLAEAREAAARGTANEDQMLLLNRERAAEEANEAKKAKNGIFNYIKGAFSMEGLKKEESSDISSKTLSNAADTSHEEFSQHTDITFTNGKAE